MSVWGSLRSASRVLFLLWQIYLKHYKKRKKEKWENRSPAPLKFVYKIHARRLLTRVAVGKASISFTKTVWFTKSSLICEISGKNKRVIWIRQNRPFKLHDMEVLSLFIVTSFITVLFPLSNKLKLDPFGIIVYWLQYRNMQLLASYCTVYTSSIYYSNISIEKRKQTKNNNKQTSNKKQKHNKLGWAYDLLILITIS